MSMAARPLPPRVPSTFAELDAHLAWLAQALEFDLEPETAQSIGQLAVVRSQAKVALLRDIRHLIAPVVTAESRPVEAQYRDAYGPDADKLATYQQEGR